MDFTIITYCDLLDALEKQGFAFQTFVGFIEKPEKKTIVLRQDVDRLPEKSLQFARVQAEQGIKGTYYFRTMPSSWDEKIIREIYSLGHEVGYHYENLGLIAQRHKVVLSEEELVNLAIEDFKKNLSMLRELVPVKTICMHGSPMSRWDSRLLWKYYDYVDFGIYAEPYFDMGFSDMLYLTDTGRRWNGGKVSVRDKSQNVRGVTEGEDSFEDWKRKPIRGSLMNMIPPALKFQGRHNFRNTQDIIDAIESSDFPEKIMMTFHPQRWTDKALPWVKELICQNTKNLGKYFLIKLRE